MVELFTTKIEKAETKLSLKITLEIVSTYRHPEKKSFLIRDEKNSP